MQQIGTTSIDNLPPSNTQTQSQIQIQPQIQPQSQNISLDISHPSSQQENKIMDNSISIQNIEQERNNDPYIKINQQTINQGTNNMIPPQTQNTQQNIEHINKDLLTLQSRDVPLSQHHITHDENIKANYIPPSSEVNNDYIKEELNREKIIQEYEKQKERESIIDKLYSELSIPFIISLLFFIFQLPFFKMYFLKFIPLLHNNDGTLKLSGLLLQTLIFCSLTYIINKFVKL